MHRFICCKAAHYKFPDDDDDDDDDNDEKTWSSV